MQRRKFTKNQIIALAVLSALIVIVIVAGAFLIVNNVNSANKLTEKLTSATSEVASAAGDEKSDKNDEQSPTAQTENSSTKSTSTSKAQENTSSKTSSTSSKTTSDSKKITSSAKTKTDIEGDVVKRVTPETNETHASRLELKVNGKTCYVGDTISVVLNIKSDKTVVNYQGTAEFDSKYLKLKEVKSNNFGIANASGTKILYNASTLNGMNFANTGTPRVWLATLPSQSRRSLFPPV